MISINNLVDKIYCINLDRRQDRWQEASRIFEANGLQVERFPAVDGRDFKKYYPCDPGNNGCTLSHYFIIERAKLLGLDSVMIFEDDADLHPAIKTLLPKCIDHLPDQWDLLYLGGSHKEKPERINKYILKVSKTLTTHAYIIRSSMFDVVINNFKNLQEPVDCFYAAWQKEYHCYVTDPPLAWQRPGFSDIQDRAMNYDHIRDNDQ